MPRFVFLTLNIHLGVAQGLVWVANMFVQTPTLSLLVHHLTHRVGPTLGSLTGVDTLPVAAVILSTGQTVSTVCPLCARPTEIVAKSKEKGLSEMGGKT